jgi:tetratricopeptide (TPR) repeat protein
MSTRQRLGCVLLAYCVLGLPASQGGDQFIVSALDLPQLEKRVVLKPPGVQLLEDQNATQPKVVATVSAVSATVDKEDGAWLLVHSPKGEAGWMKKDDALTPPEAVPFFTARIAADARDAEAYARRAAAKQLLGETAAALADIEMAVKLKPGVASWYTLHGAIVIAGNGDLRWALADFEEAIRLDPLEAPAHNNIAFIHLAMGQKDQALADLSEAVRLRPKCSSTYAERAVIWQAMDAHDKAIADLDEAVRLDPTNFLALLNRGALHGVHGDYDKGLADDNKVIALRPDLALPYCNRASCYQHKGEIDKAIADLDIYLRLKPTDPVALRARASMRHLNKKDLDRALADLNESVRLCPQVGDAFACRAAVWQDKGDYVKAAADFGEAIRLMPQTGRLHCGRGVALQLQRSYTLAIADFDTALWLNANDVEALNDKSWLLATCPDAKFRDGKKAVELANRACELAEWKVPGCLGTLAAACAEAGDFANAVKHQTKALENADYARDFGVAARERLKLYQAGTPYHEK